MTCSYQQTIPFVRDSIDASLYDSPLLQIVHSKAGSKRHCRGDCCSLLGHFQQQSQSVLAVHCHAMHACARVAFSLHTHKQCNNFVQSAVHAVLGD